MEHRALGRSGVDVSRIILGCGNFGGIGSSPAFFGAGRDRGRGPRAAWTPPGRPGSRRSTPPTPTAAAAASRPSAAGSHAGRGVRDRSSDDEDLQPDGARATTAASRRDRILRQIDTSLERLGVERVDLYLAHAFDPTTPLEETLRRVRGARRAPGKIGAYGGSNSTPAGSRGARAAAEPGSGAELATRSSTGTTRTACSRSGARRPRLHAVQPARRRLADGEVPPRRGAAGRAPA